MDQPIAGWLLMDSFYTKLRFRRRPNCSHLGDGLMCFPPTLRIEPRKGGHESVDHCAHCGVHCWLHGVDGQSGVNSSLRAAVRTTVLVIVWSLAASNTSPSLKEWPWRIWLMLALSAFAIGPAWWFHWQNRATASQGILSRGGQMQPNTFSPNEDSCQLSCAWIWPSRRC